MQLSNVMPLSWAMRTSAMLRPPYKQRPRGKCCGAFRDRVGSYPRPRTDASRSCKSRAGRARSAAAAAPRTSSDVFLDCRALKINSVKHHVGFNEFSTLNCLPAQAVGDSCLPAPQTHRVSGAVTRACKLAEPCVYFLSFVGWL